MNAPDTSAQPILSAERIHTLDILRGFALLGMILVHFHSHSTSPGGAEDLIRTAIWRLAETKAHGTFALLFGAGFAIQLRRADARGSPFALLYLRRLAVLALFGFAAHALFGFNVLMGYALWGVPLLLIRRWSTCALIAVAIFSAISLQLYTLLFKHYEVAIHGPDGANAAIQALRETARNVNAAVHEAGEQPDYLPLLKARLHHMAWFSRQPWFFLPCNTLALFIAGLLAVRHGILEHPLAHKRTIAAMMLFGVVAWVIDNWVAGDNGPRAYRLLGIFDDQWLAFTYVGGLLLLFARWPRSVTLLRPIGQAGRMALTNYILQIAVLDLLFSGYGFHLPEIRPLLVPLATALLFGSEVILSTVWLRSFRFGPAEWAWRSLTYGRAQPMLR
jgi:uncharacterized protein